MAFIDLGDQFIALQRGRKQPADDGRHFGLVVDDKEAARKALKPVSRKAMLEEVWGLHEDTDTRAIDNFMVRLRRYIEEDPRRPHHLLTVRGVGYRFVAEPTRLEQST